MHIDLIVIVFTFVLLVFIVFVSENLSTALLIISLFSNFFIISLSGSKLLEKGTSAVKKITFGNWDTANSRINDTTDAEDIYECKNIKNKNSTTYSELGNREATNERETAYRDEYDDSAYSVDEKISKISASRNLDKKALKGQQSKKKDYFAKHFGNEFTESENKIWWEENEWK